MRKSAVICLGLVSWLLAQGCVFAHDTGCVDSSDCKSGRTCNAGECVDIGSGGDDNPSTNEGNTPGNTGSSSVTPECPVSELGTSPTANQSAALMTASATKSILMSASGNKVTYIGGNPCTLIKKPSFTSNAPCNDLYRCGGCDMLLSKQAQPPESTLSGMTQWTLGLWAPDDGSCKSWDATYYVSKGSSSSGSSGGSNDACHRCSSACSGIPGCSCCAECGGFCFN